MVHYYLVGRRLCGVNSAPHWTLEQPTKTINRGTYDSMLPIFNTASEVGYGAVIHRSQASLSFVIAF